MLVKFRPNGLKANTHLSTIASWDVVSYNVKANRTVQVNIRLGCVIDLPEYQIKRGQSPTENHHGKTDNMCSEKKQKRYIINIHDY